MVISMPDWRGIAVRGAVAIVFGVVALAWPHITVTALVLLFGAFVLLDGAMNLLAAAGHDPDDQRRRFSLALEGVAGVVVGLITLVAPGVTTLVLLWFIAAWAFVTGVFEIAAAIGLRNVIRHEWLLGVMGALSILFAIVLVSAPVSGAIAITWLIGWYAVLFGIVLLALSWQLRKFQRAAGTAGARVDT